MKNRNLPLKIAAVCLLFSIGNANAQDFKSIIQNHVSAKSGILKSDLKNFEITNEDFSKSMNANVIDIQQSYNGIPIYNATGKVMIKKDQVAYYVDTFTKNYVNASQTTSTRTNKDIFGKVATTLNLKDSNTYKMIGMKDADLDTPFVKTKMVYFQTPLNDLRLCHEYVFAEKGTSNYWDILADAITGEILSKQNLTVSCSFAPGIFEQDYSKYIADHQEGLHDHSNEKEVSVATALAPLDASYRVFALPLEAPSFGSRTLISNPWFLDASPEGWHTIPTGSTYAGSYNTTRGNNVMAYDDKANTNTPGAYANGGANRVFDFPFIVNDTAGNLNAATTNLFYMNNKMHDILYRFGFTETSKNFQAWNFGKGGLQDDYVMAESQDGGGMDNANFTTPPDGYRGKMQMYLWNPTQVERVFYNTPPEAVGRVVTNYVSSTFGPTLDVTGVTADVKVASVLDGCTALPANSLTGKIGLMMRGTCGFTVKVKNAQNAGATAAIIYNAPDSTPTTGMGGTDATITIPSVLIENPEGIYMKNLIDAQTNVNVTLKYDQSQAKFRDGSFDNGIIAHEYGHGLSTRLIGSLNANVNKEQMGEGWSDFMTLMLTNKPGDNASVPRGIGTYAISQPINGGGIRPAPYSPNFGVNNFTYAKTNGMEYTNALGQLVPNVHSIGFVWATMLWDLHWKYVEKYGYASDIVANPNSGSGKVFQLIVNALKLTPANPGFIQGRDAILAAEAAMSNKADKCMIWEVFAKRGLGVNASAGSPTNINDQVADFTEPAPDPACTSLATSETAAKDAMSIYPNPAKNEFFVKSGKAISGKMMVEIFDASGKLVSSQKVVASEAVNTQSLPSGVYVVKVSGMGVNYSSKLMIKK